MSKTFEPCKGKTACQENDSGCRTCGRSVEEIYTTRALIDQLVDFARKMDYTNSQDFFDYVATKAAKKLKHRQEEQLAAGG